jgi:hypothetical protein
LGESWKVVATHIIQTSRLIEILLASSSLDFMLLEFVAQPMPLTNGMSYEHLGCLIMHLTHSLHATLLC